MPIDNIYATTKRSHYSGLTTSPGAAVVSDTSALVTIPALLGFVVYSGLAIWNRNSRLRLAFGGLLALPAVAAWTFIALVLWSTVYAERFIDRHGSSVQGVAVSELVRLHGSPNTIRKVGKPAPPMPPGAYPMGFEPYEVWYYCPWPSYVHIVPPAACLKIFVSEEHVSSLKAALK